MHLRYTQKLSAYILGALISPLWPGGAAARDYAVISRFPHDTSAYTQGLVYHRGQLYESTGRLGRSQVRRVELATGRVLESRALPSDRFGEGLALLHGKLYQLTWRSGAGYVYDAASLALIDTFRYEGEGWGLATDGELLIMSDGSARLRFLHPQTFATVRTVTVRYQGRPLKQINELEHIGGHVYANVYPIDKIVRIDPASGKVLNWYDLSGLLPDEQRGTGMRVLNGIAYKRATDTFLVTGKLWPALFEIVLRRPADWTDDNDR